MERLEIQVNRSRKNLEDPQRAQAVESALGTKIQKLRCLRDELRAEVKQRQARVSARVTLAGFPGVKRASMIWELANFILGFTCDLTGLIAALDLSSDQPCRIN